MTGGENVDRITSEMVDAEIVSRRFFTLGDVFGQSDPLDGNVTICVLTMKNGYRVVGKSIAPSPKNYTKALGQRLAHDDAVRQAWSLVGYKRHDG